MTRDELVTVLTADSLFSDLRPYQIERSHACRIRVGWPMFAVLDTSMGKHEIAGPHGR